MEYDSNDVPSDQNPNIIDLLLSRKEVNSTVDSDTLIKKVQNKINTIRSSNGLGFGFNTDKHFYFMR